MTVANRLRGALAVHVAAIVALAVIYAHSIHRAAEASRALAAAAMGVSDATDRLARVDELSADAEKYRATNDTRYRDKFATAFQEFGVFDSRVMQPVVLDSVRQDAQAAGDAARTEMQQVLLESQAAAGRASRVAWLAALGALVLGLLLAAVLVKSIVSPLERLAQGTRWVSAGRFDYRLDASAGDEFAIVAKDFNSMTERLGELDRMKKDFIARVSHDLKTPLTSMRETNNALLDHMAGPLTAKQRQLLEINVDSAQRLSAMLGKLLDLSRLEGGQRPVLRMVDVNEIARRAVHAATVGATQRGVRVAIAGAEPSLVLGDATGISQVVDNLVENAIKFSPANGRVQVSVAPSEREVTLTVADDGPGIPQAERDRVFDRFYQTEGGRNVPGRGVGLGLTICREIITAHGGRIWVDANKPQGSVFHVVLRRGVAAAAGFILASAAACAPFHQSPPATRPEDFALRIESLTAEVDATRAQRDSLIAQADSLIAKADSLRLELQRLKEIDLRPRASRRPPR
jgi:signal transduction histidine kinase